MTALSVIVPVYNGREHLSRCIKSLCVQTLTNIEIILVDDGSTDDSGTLCDQFAKEDNRIISVHKPNGGLGSARNYGIGIASSEYIGFVDCDDWVNKDTYAYLFNLAIQYDADIASGKFAIVHTENEMIDSQDPHVEVYEGIEKNRIYLEIGIKDRSSQYSVCTKIYRKNLFEIIRFPEGQLYEDVVTNYKLLEIANKFVLSSKYVYNYYMKTTSITRNRCTSKDMDLIMVGRQIEELTCNTEIQELGKILRARTNFSIIVKMLLYGTDESMHKSNARYEDFYNTFLDDYKLLMRSRMPKSRKTIMYMLRRFPHITIFAFSVLRKFRGRNEN